MRYIFLLYALIACAASITAAEPVLHIMPMGDSITQADDPGYRGFLFRQLTDAGHTVDFVGTMTGKPKLPAQGDLDADHEGHGGFTVGPGPSAADQWTGGKGNLFANLDDWLAPTNAKTKHVDIVLLHVGVNDYANIKERDPSYQLERDFVKRYAGLVDKILSLRPTTAIIISSVIPGGNPDIKAVFPIGPFDKLNPMLKAVAEARSSHVFFRDGASLQGTGLAWEPSDWNTGDVIHPNGKGQEKFAKFWFAAIDDLLTGGKLPKTAYVKKPSP